MRSARGDWWYLMLHRDAHPYNARRGDCVVAFGRQALFKAKQYLERTTELKVGVIYGSLPPETRKEQARAFNDADGG